MLCIVLEFRTSLHYTMCFLFIIAEDDPGTRRSELIDWYLKEMENEIESEQELIERKTLAEKVLYRLVHHVSAIFCPVLVGQSITCGILPGRMRVC